MAGEFSDKVVIITGAASGIGSLSLERSLYASSL
jgi:NADP-dependent 3-hydroxy acid dehydrogenase YdfG